MSAKRKDRTLPGQKELSASAPSITSLSAEPSVSSSSRKKRAPAEDVTGPPAKRSKASDSLPDSSAPTSVPDNPAIDVVSPASADMVDSDPEGAYFCSLLALYASEAAFIGKTIVAQHFPASHWAIACSTEGCACAHCGPPRAMYALYSSPFSIARSSLTRCSSCCACDHPVQAHQLRRIQRGGKGSVAAAVNTVFQLVKAARACAFVFQFFHWVGPLLSAVQSEATSLKLNVSGLNVSPQLKGLVFAFQELLNQLPSLPQLESCSTRFLIVGQSGRLIFAFDLQRAMKSCNVLELKL